MGKTVEIINLKRNKIEQKVGVKKQGVIVPISLAFIVITLLCFSFGGSLLGDIGNDVAYVFNPVNSLYNDNSELVFTSGTLAEKNKLDFILPIKSEKINCLGNSIDFECTNSIMVMAIESGVVREIGVTLDGVKYIKIQHSAEMDSVIENVDIIGVSIGNIVKRGQDIATVQVGEVITLKIFDKGSQVGNLRINQSRVLWKD